MSSTGYQVKEIKKTAVGLMVEKEFYNQNKQLLTLKWIVDFDIEAVSYTHLDVYKRQARQ